MYELKIKRAKKEHPELLAGSLEEISGQLADHARSLGVTSFSGGEGGVLSPEGIVAFAAYIFDTTPENIQFSQVVDTPLVSITLMSTKLHALEAEVSQVRAQRDRMIREAYQKGYTPTKIGQAVGLHRNLIHRIVKGTS